MGIYEIIKALEVNPKDIFGNSIGSLTAAYAKNILTFEEVVNSSVFAASLYQMKQDKANTNSVQEKISTFLTQLLSNKNNAKLKSMVQDTIQSLFNGNEATIKLPHHTTVLSLGNIRFECINPNVLEILKENPRVGVENLLLNLGK